MKKTLVLVGIIAALALSLLSSAVAQEQCKVPAYKIAPPIKVIQTGKSAKFQVIPLHSSLKKVPGNVWYVVAGSFSTRPGFNLLGAHVPLAIDPMFEASLVYANSSIFENTFGLLDKNRKATFRINVPKVPQLRGLTVFFAAGVFEENTLAFRVTSPVVLKVR